MVKDTVYPECWHFAWFTPHRFEEAPEQHDETDMVDEEIDDCADGGLVIMSGTCWSVIDPDQLDVDEILEDDDE